MEREMSLSDKQDFGLVLNPTEAVVSNHDLLYCYMIVTIKFMVTVEPPKR